MRKMITIALLTLGTAALHAQDGADALMQKFVSDFAGSETTAVREAFATNPWIQENSEDVDNLVAQIDEVLKYLGEFIDAEQVEKIQLSERLVVYTYLMNYERQPVRYIIDLYKSKDTWMFYNIQYNLSFSEEMVANYRLSRGNN